jgi:hypothetical protein
MITYPMSDDVIVCVTILQPYVEGYRQYLEGVKARTLNHPVKWREEQFGDSVTFRIMGLPDAMSKGEADFRGGKWRGYNGL